MPVLEKLGWAAGLALLAYAPFLSLPLISDDYIQIFLSRAYGPVSGWRDLAQDVLYRSRATSLVLTHAVDAWFGIDPTAHRLLSLLVHIANVGCVALLGNWKRIGWRVSAPAAVFFAVYEGQQEAVVWSAALPELLVFFFGVGSLVVWIQGRPALASGLYVVALLSKESAVAVLPLMAWHWWREERQVPGRWSWLAGMGAVSAAYAAGIFAAQDHHLHLNDGTFSWTAPFWLTLPASMLRLLWIWGLLAVSFLVLMRRELRTVAFGLGWMAVMLLPYSFLTYMDRVPSRNVYLAGAGLALIVGSAYAALEESWGRRLRWLPGAVVLAILVHNLGYLWLKKLDQYERRAEVTERFLREAARHEQPITLQCVAYDADVYRYAAALRLGSPVDRIRPVDQAPDAAVEYCDPVHP